MTNMNPDPNWPNGGYTTGDATKVRPALTRAWHGYILAANQDNSISNGVGPIWTHLYDFFYGGSGWLTSRQWDTQIGGAPAMVYSGLYAYFFFPDASGNLAWTAAFQPAVDSGDHSLQFDNPINYQPVINTGLSIGIGFGVTAAILNGRVFVAWLSGNNIAGTSLCIAGADLSDPPNLSFGQPQVFTLSAPIPTEPSLVAFGNQLYCLYADPSGNMQVATMSEDNKVFTLSSGPAKTASGQNLTCSYAPAVAADPGGAFLMAVFAEPGNGQLCTSYLTAAGKYWTAPQQIGSDQTNASPAVLATATGQAYLLYKRTDSDSTEILLSRNLATRSGVNLIVYNPTLATGSFYSIDSQGDVTLQKTNTGWRNTWSIIVSGNFSGSQFDTLLFYDNTNGIGEFYSTDGQGNITLLKQCTGWRKTWSIIVSGNFAGGQYDTLLFYDGTNGLGKFYSTDGQGNITLLKQYTGWRNSWSLVVPGNLTSTESADLLFYDATNGDGQLCSIDGKGI